MPAGTFIDWMGLGILDGVGNEFPRTDIERVRLVRFAVRRGNDPEAIAHFYVHERRRADGLAGEELGEATRAGGDPLRQMIEPAVLYFHRKAHQRALREHFLLHLALDSTDPTEARARMTGTILFADLSGFTPMTEAMGDAAAADVVERFAALVRDLAHRHNGRVKQIGDEFMVRFNGAGDAVGFGVDLESATAEEPTSPPSGSERTPAMSSTATATMWAPTSTSPLASQPRLAGTSSL